MKKNPIITIMLDDGAMIKIELYPEMAPNTVHNFIHLIQSKFYDGIGFHRIIKNFMIQGGCPLGNGTGGPGYTIKGEFDDNGLHNPLKHDRGVISMARTMDPDSAGSQFFIMHKDAPHLDGQYASFGMVIEGIEVLDNIAVTKTNFNDKPLTDIIMQEVTVETFGVDYPEPQKI
ncbi:MAG: peptidylprolyl isomerase [Eubacteriales bacterium]